MVNTIIFGGEYLKPNQRYRIEKGFLGNFSHAIKDCIMATAWYMLIQQSKFCNRAWHEEPMYWVFCLRSPQTLSQWREWPGEVQERWPGNRSDHITKSWDSIHGGHKLPQIISWSLMKVFRGQDEYRRCMSDFHNPAYTAYLSLDSVFFLSPLVRSSIARNKLF